MDFESYVNSNISLFKNNIVDIISKFKSSQNKSREKFNKIFECQNNIFVFNEAELAKFGVTKEAQGVIAGYLNELGKNEYEFEKEKNKNFEVYIKSQLGQAKKVYDEKGSLYFKLLLLLSAVICIIIWWYYGCFNFI